jgi:hypothetical protein
MRILAYVVVSVFLLSSAACSGKGGDSGSTAGGAKDGKPKELIVGKWELGEGIAKETWDFQPDGTLLVKQPGLVINTKYNFVEDKVFTIEKGDQTITVLSIGGDQMTLQRKTGEKDEYKRVK